MTRTLRIAAGVTALLLASLLMYKLADHARQERASWPIEESYVTLPSPDAARWSYLGYNELAADLTWIRLLVYYGSGFLGDGDFRYLGKFVQNVIALDPKFKKVYQWASYSVTVTTDHRMSTASEDIMQSIEVLEGAMKEFPEDYEFFWLAGIRYFLDLKSDDPKEQRAYKEQGAAYLEAAMQRPNAPKNLATRAASFRSQLGQFEQARANLMQMIMTSDDNAAQEQMLAAFGQLAPKGMAQELEAATKEFNSSHTKHLPQISSDLFVLLGGPPSSAVIDLEALATERSLLGIEENDGLSLFH